MPLSRKAQQGQGCRGQAATTGGLSHLDLVVAEVTGQILRNDLLAVLVRRAALKYCDLKSQARVRSNLQCKQTTKGSYSSVLFGLVLFFETGSHIAQAILKFIM